MAKATSKSPFYVPIDIRHTALLISDVQTQILARFPKESQESYLAQIQTLLDFFRSEITKAQSSETGGNGLHEDIPLIVHHTLPFNLNANAFVSPYNKLAKWVKQLEEKGLFATTAADPHQPNFAIPSQLTPPGGWGSKDEIVLGKLSPSCFASSDLLKYFNARGIRHVVLVGLTTMGSILGSARQGADMDFHIICPREAIIDDEPEVDEFIMTKILPKFVDVVRVEDVLALGDRE